ncbi:hypothetical protein EWM64_g9355, partial [Hericium alpestre]
MSLRSLRFAGAASVLVNVGRALAAPSGFPNSGNGLWYTQPGADWTSEFLPIGNGYLAAMVPGGIAQETTQLNIESLWAGGPFQDPNYVGSVPDPSERDTLAQEMQEIHRAIFANVKELEVTIGAYGSYAGSGWLISTLDVSGDVSNYGRWLDLDSALAKTQWDQGGDTFLRYVPDHALISKVLVTEQASSTTFCSNPIEACIEHTNTTASTMPTLTYAFSTVQETDLPVPTITCLDNSTLDLRGQVGSPGMAYELVGRVQASSGTQIACSAVGISNAIVS